MLRTTDLEDTLISSRQHLPFRIAASTYLNSAPLVWSFLYGSMQGLVEFVDAVPSRCARLLSQSEVDAALIPVIEYQRIQDGSLVRDVCVGSKGEVRSVVLVSRKRDLSDIQSVALDESSRTSATLVKIIFKEFLEHEPKWTTQSSNVHEMLQQNDAALMIGDPAMVFYREGLQLWDMARLWRNYTGLGFVFAMWMIRNSVLEESRKIDFGAVRDEGVSKTDEIVQAYSEQLGLSAESLREYLEENISFRLDEQLQAGLDLYFRLAHKHGLIPELKPLKTR